MHISDVPFRNFMNYTLYFVFGLVYDSCGVLGILHPFQQHFSYIGPVMCVYARSFIKHPCTLGPASLTVRIPVHFILNLGTRVSQ